MSKVIQNHHPFNARERKRIEDFTTVITRGEHQILTLIQRYCAKDVSEGFIQCLEIYIAMWRAGFAEVIDYESILELQD